MLLLFAFVVLAIYSFPSSTTTALTIDDIPSAPEDGGKLWVLLVAGSNGWFNYRHQADVCHAYQIVHAHGVPDENVVVMMYDDIAYNMANPTPGKVINRPNGTDVYRGVPKDYNCQHNNPRVFLDALQGHQMPKDIGSGKVLQTGSKDYIFVYFSDHGAKGILGFGQEILKASNLTRAIKDMADNNKFAKMVFYVEACESGSMFKGLLPSNINVYATTASNATTSSYACYYDKQRKTFLGDVYSVKWLEDSDRKDIWKETLEQQFLVVKNETNTSTVCQFGDMAISKLPVADFQGEAGASEHPPPRPPPFPSTCGRDAVPSEDVPVAILQRRISQAENAIDAAAAREELTNLQRNRQFMLAKVRAVAEKVTGGNADAALRANREVSDWPCYYAAVDAFHERCFNLGLNDFAMRQTYVFANLCYSGFSAAAIVAAVKDECQHPKMVGIY